ncbi:MAG: hypothetical protein ACKPHN_08975 [Microcystis panniformis]|nr:hypothetical protein [Microcystis sp. M63BS1]
MAFKIAILLVKATIVLWREVIDSVVGIILRISLSDHPVTD